MDRLVELDVDTKVANLNTGEPARPHMVDLPCQTTSEDLLNVEDRGITIPGQGFRVSFYELVFGVDQDKGLLFEVVDALNLDYAHFFVGRS